MSVRSRDGTLVLADSGSEQGAAGEADAEGASPEFEAAWRLHATQIRRRCLGLMGRRDDAEEAFSRAGAMAFVKYAGHRARIRDVRHWLLRVAHNVCIDMHRERARERRYAGPALAEVEPRAAVPDCQRTDPELRLLRGELRAVLRSAVEKLPPRLRRPLELRLHAQWRDREIAATLNLSEANVRKRLQEARAALRPLLRAYLLDAACAPAVRPPVRGAAGSQAPAAESRSFTLRTLSGAATPPADAA